MSNSWKATESKQTVQIKGLVRNYFSLRFNWVGSSLRVGNWNNSYFFSISVLMNSNVSFFVAFKITVSWQVEDLRLWHSKEVMIPWSSTSRKHPPTRHTMSWDVRSTWEAFESENWVLRIWKMPGTLQGIIQWCWNYCKGQYVSSFPFFYCTNTELPLH